MSEIAIVGAGAWGTALSIILGRTGAHRIRLWVHEQEVRDTIASQRVNEKFLPGQHIPTSVTACNDVGQALDSAAIVVSVMPSQHCRLLFERMRTASAGGNDDCQRDQRAGREFSAAHDRGDHTSDHARRYASRHASAR